MIDESTIRRWGWPLLHAAIWTGIAVFAYDRGHAEGRHSAPEFVEYQIGRHERAVEFMDAFDSIDLFGGCGEGPATEASAR